MPNQHQFIAGCPMCGGETQVKDVRALKCGDVTRRRQCNACGYRYTTIEILYGPHPRCKEVARWASEHNRDIFHRGDE